jgi:hypothetical protein
MKEKLGVPNSSLSEAATLAYWMLQGISVLLQFVYWEG